MRPSELPHKIHFLVHVRSLALTLVASLIELETLQPFEPSSERLEFFESTTGMLSPRQQVSTSLMSLTYAVLVTLLQYNTTFRGRTQKAVATLNPASRSLAPNATRRSIRKLWASEDFAMKLLSVVLAVSCYFREPCSVHKTSVANELSWRRYWTHTLEK